LTREEENSLILDDMIYAGALDPCPSLEEFDSYTVRFPRAKEGLDNLKYCFAK
jgi:hypothetical protein